MRTMYALLLFILFSPTTSYAEPEDRVLSVEKTMLTWTMPTTNVDGSPITKDFTRSDVYCSDTDGVRQGNITFRGETAGSVNRYMLTNLPDGNWYCRVTTTTDKEADYSNEVNFPVVGGVVPGETYPSRSTASTE